MDSDQDQTDAQAVQRTSRYTCKTCNKHYDVYSSYYSHTKKHDVAAIECRGCGLKFHLKTQLYRHAFLQRCGGIPSNTQTQQSVPQLRYTPDTMQALPIIPQV
jgi:DNA-directed RNA polymerase subunit RPC12/RpoP